MSNSHAPRPEVQVRPLEPGDAPALHAVLTCPGVVDHTALVPNSIDHSMFDAQPREKQPVPTVGFMYAIGGIKGADVALEAIRRLREKLPALRVISFGTHTPVGVDGFDGIEFRRLPSVQELQAAYSSCDVWLCPGRSEGFGLPAMEAMGCRTPIVSTR